MLSKKKTIDVVSFTGNSGLTDYAVSLCHALQAHCEVRLITADSYDPSQYGHNASFPAKKLFRRTRHYAIDIWRFIWFVLSQRPDVVLLQSWIKFPEIEWLFVLLFRAVGIKVALTVHDLLPHYPKPWSRFVLSKYYRCFNQLIVHSNKAKDGLKQMGVSQQPLVVPHGVYDIFNFDRLTRKQAVSYFPELAEEDFIVLFFGHIQTRKGIFEFLNASKLLLDQPKIKFVVAGANDLSVAEQRQLDTYRAQPNVLIHDEKVPTEVVQRYFALADVIALPYLEGTTSGVVKLAMAFDKPIIVTDIGDFAETLSSWSGELINSNESLPDALAEAVVNMQRGYNNYLNQLSVNKVQFEWATIAQKYFNHIQ